MKDHRAEEWIETYRRHSLLSGSPLFVDDHPALEYVLDFNETPYLDFTAADGVMIHGQGNSYIQNRIKEQVSGVYFSGSSDDHVHGSQMELLRRLVTRFGEKSRYLFRTSDTEAFSALHPVLPESEPGLSIAVVNRKRPILAEPYQSAAFSHYDHPAMLVADALGSKRIKAILVCPLDPDTHETIDPSLLERAIEISEQAGIPIVWDETVLGGGWGGEAFSTPSYASYSVLGGALGGGLPLGVIVDRTEESADLTDAEDLSGMFAGSPLSCAAAVATLDALLMNLQRGGVVYPLVEKTDDELLHLQKTFPEVITGITGHSLKRGIRFRTVEIARAVRNQCAEDGLLLGWSTYSGNVTTVTTSLAVTTKDVEEMSGIVLAALMKVMEKHDD